MSAPPTFAAGPARDGRFEVKDRWSEMVNLPEDHPDAGKEFLHRQLNEELNSLEMAARNLVDFPEADWNLRLAIARQCSDEARHAIAFRRLLEARGGSVGEFPVLNFQYRIITAIDTLIGRLAVANRGFEAAGIDAIQDGIDSSRKSNDTEFIRLFRVHVPLRIPLHPRPSGFQVDQHTEGRSIGRHLGRHPGRPVSPASHARREYVRCKAMEF